MTNPAPKTEAALTGREIAGCVGLFALIVVTWYFVPGLVAGKLTAPTDRGGFGDTFGSVNALFTGLAFAGLLVTILLQRKELALTRQTMIDQQAEMVRSADAQKEIATLQAETARIAKEQSENQLLATSISAIEQSEDILAEWLKRAYGHRSGIDARINAVEWLPDGSGRRPDYQANKEYISLKSLQLKNTEETQAIIAEIEENRTELVAITRELVARRRRPSVSTAAPDIMPGS